MLVRRCLRSAVTTAFKPSAAAFSSSRAFARVHHPSTPQHSRNMAAVAAQGTANTSVVAPPAVENADLRLAKRAMRKEIAQKLNSLSQEQLSSYSSRLLASLCARPEWKAAPALCLFVSMPSGEVQTREIIQLALEQKKRVFVPRIVPQPKKDGKTAEQGQAAVAEPAPSASSSFRTDMWMLEVSSISDLDSWKANNWGIKEPPLLHAATETKPEQPRQEAHDCPELSLVVCPGVAFDSSCQRLGHGKGYYDRFIASLLRQREATNTDRIHTIGLGFDEQIVERVPTGPMDIPLDAVVTPTKVYRAEEERTS
jgi:5-formyltetrahydrofolate cyclo-ligase